MNERPWRFLLMLGLVWLVFPAVGRGQGREYVPIPFSGNLEEMLRMHSQDAGNLDQLLKERDALLKKLKELKIDVKPIENLDWSRPEVKKLLDKVAPNGTVQSEKIKALVSNFGKLNKKSDEQEKAIVNRPAGKEPGRLRRPAAEPETDLQDRFSRWARDLMKEAEGTQVGDMIRESPAWQQGLLDFQKYLLEHDLEKNWGLSLPKNLDLSLFEKGMSKIKNVPLPELPSVNFRLPGFRLGHSLLGVPSIPGPRGLAIGQIFLWLLVGIGLVIVLWQMFGRRLWSSSVLGGERLGPWPVDPARITTAAQLIAAFEYVALLRLGSKARAWNHRLIAGRLAAGNSDRSQAAHELAGLYERARYAPDTVSLAGDVMARARRQLCFLAGEKP